MDCLANASADSGGPLSPPPQPTPRARAARTSRHKANRRIGVLSWSGDTVLSGPARADRRRAIRYFEDFTEGQVIPLGTLAPLTEDEIIAFARQWDPQPFHVDPAAAKESIYGGLIASGWQTALRTMRLQVENLLNDTDAQGSPGVEAIRFRKPVRAGDRLSARYTVLVAEPSASRPTLGKVLGRTELLDEAGDVVYQMDGWGLVGRRPSAPVGESTSS
ncbi:MAG TPA: MaoC family dehydratase [Acidimicrobiia bacterium]|nr:MaoC family dehydratase [Acidimicrobiia bacterium]